ncbi:1-phosphofructokinase family hexose kinase [Corynebacterium sanguinis]|uniref:1-phosphofructokinase family hexose kinase n=1 Tax=Corynebacterium sanguinis TaxID=2594913 RepID=UPI00223BED54|nr:1-phosphofructokinase family hexose kinase [Corynebacterium sanguinis]MCT1426287.1 1-phosphofructokinase family hexose kinase [Corynebacterium sanguinis]MCT1627643.1 1-phosphofructokinase family hexose kinase [Corynebacterium sanguinis]MCT2153400.1 1-phosphofructokinase family hexose kinase [Corynebacterium sanguinis]
MIITFTPNPSIDATLELDSLERGGVNRTITAHREAGGKGINVSHACTNAGRDTLAIAPCGPSDPFTLICRNAGIPLKGIPISGAIRTNTTLTERDGSTTKVNETGPLLRDDDVTRITDVLISTVAETRADAVVMAGSLPPGAPPSWYATLAQAVRMACPGAVVAIDTSDAPLAELGKNLADAKPDVIKPNAFELAQLTGADGDALERQAASGDYRSIVVHARKLISDGVKEVLVTLGSAGACLVTATGAWAATAPPMTTRSTVGAGDSALAGYIMARVEGADPSECLRRGVAYGSAAAAKPGTGIPSPDEVDTVNTHVVALETEPR